jgi:hypothetical protein
LLGLRNTFYVGTPDAISYTYQVFLVSLVFHAFSFFLYVSTAFVGLLNKGFDISGLHSSMICEARSLGGMRNGYY